MAGRPVPSTSARDAQLALSLRALFLPARARDTGRRQELRRVAPCAVCADLVTVIQWVDPKGRSGVERLHSHL